MLSVVVPTYQERRALEDLLPRLAAVRRVLPEGLEVLVVDDGSTDGTAEFAEAFFAAERFGSAVRREGPADLAQAVLDGIRQARGAWIAVMDADLSHPPELLPALLRAVTDGCQLAVASRYAPQGRIMNWPWSRRALSRLGNWLVRPLVPVADATSGYFLGEAALLKGLVVSPRGFKILLEILVRGGVHRVREVPYTFEDRRHGASKLGWRVLRLYLAQVLQLYAYRVRQAYRRTQVATGESG